MNGIIVINKEEGYTSNDVVQIVKKIFKEKVGHTGTLDPMATGVLPLLIGKGTLCSKYLINHDKIYEATLKLGIKTDTGDITGKEICKEDINIDKLKEEFIKEKLNCFIGKQEQIPPIYSAIKVNGKKLYEYARSGQKVEIQSRTIMIYDIKLIRIDKNSKEITFEVSCSKGTYIRTLCEDIARKLGTIGTMSKLNRKKVGDFSIQNAISVNELKDNFENENFIRNHFIDIESLFIDKEKIDIDNKELKLLLNGVKLNRKENNEIYRIYNNDKFIGIGIIKDKLLKRDIII